MTKIAIYLISVFYKVSVSCRAHEAALTQPCVNMSAPGLRVPSACELVVGGEPQCWSEGSCLLFDDSFLHKAFHEGESTPHQVIYRTLLFQKVEIN